MRPLLMHPDRDFAPKAALPWNERALRQDLALDLLLDAMADGDDTVRAVSSVALLSGRGDDRETILHRQGGVRDCLANPSVVRQLYETTLEAMTRKRDSYYFGYKSDYPSLMLHGSIALLGTYAAMLRRLRVIAETRASQFSSAGFTSLFETFRREFSDEYLARLGDQLAALQFRPGILLSASLGEGNAARDYVLHQVPRDTRSWLRRLVDPRTPSYTYRVPERDEMGFRELSELRDRGIATVAAVLGQAAAHVDGFFHSLQVELAFYIGCLNLHKRLEALGAPTSLPRPCRAGGMGLQFRGLYDPCLALQLGRRPVGNDADARGKTAIILTGANRGGKSTLLRALGVGQLMMEAGLFVGAESFEGELSTGLVTHFRREEDAGLKRGRLDEELARMSEAVDHLRPGAVVLLNESFGSTNEREGSEIARQIVRALLEAGVRVRYVTHLHAFARESYERSASDTLFLRAERLADGTRTFRLIQAEPLATSYGRDLYERIFSPDSGPSNEVGTP